MDAYRLGKEARMNGRDSSRNPFERLSSEWKAWHEGWVYIDINSDIHKPKPIKIYRRRSIPSTCGNCEIELVENSTADGFVNIVCPVCDRSYGCRPK